MFEHLLQDTSHAYRVLARNPSFTLAAVLILTLGIGGVTVVLSIVDATIFQPLPLPEPDSLFTIKAIDSNGIAVSPLPEEYEAWADLADSFSAISAMTIESRKIDGLYEPEFLLGAAVSIDFFGLAGEPVLGRAFLAEEDRPGGEAVVVLDHGVWLRKFSGDPSVIGRSVRLGDEAFTIIGVMPEGFRFPQLRWDFWVSLNRDPLKIHNAPRPLRVYARLRPDRTVAQTAQKLEDSIVRAPAASLAQARGVQLQPLHESITGSFERPTLILLGAVAMVLLIVIANVSNLTLAHVSRRQNEIAIRLAVGSGRLRIVRYC